MQDAVDRSNHLNPSATFAMPLVFSFIMFVLYKCNIIKHDGLLLAFQQSSPEPTIFFYVLAGDRGLPQLRRAIRDEGAVKIHPKPTGLTGQLSSSLSPDEP